MIQKYNLAVDYMDYVDYVDYVDFSDSTLVFFI